MNAKIFLSEKELPQVSIEQVRRGLEFLAQKSLAPDEAAVLAQHGLLRTGAPTGEKVSKPKPARILHVETPEDQKIFEAMKKMSDRELAVFINKIISLARRSRMQGRPGAARRDFFDADRATVLLAIEPESSSESLK